MYKLFELKKYEMKNQKVKLLIEKIININF